MDASGQEYNALHNGEISAALSYAASDSISIEPIVAYSTPLSDDAKDAIKGMSYDEKETIFYGGVTVSMGF